MRPKSAFVLGCWALGLAACAASYAETPSPPAATPADDSPPATGNEHASLDWRAPTPGENAVVVDPRVELVGALFRAAQAPGWSVSFNDGVYHPDVDARLERLGDHPAVEASRRLVAEHGIGYDAVPSLAIHLTWPELELDATALHDETLLDPRWATVDLERYLAQVRDFNASYDVASLLVEHRQHLDMLEARYPTVMERYGGENLEPWFTEHFDETNVANRFVPGMLTGQANYGLSVRHEDGRRTAYPVISLPTDPDRARARDVAPIVFLVVHEYAHGFVNPKTATRVELLQPVGEALFEPTASHMKRLGYGAWKMVVDETIVRAVTRAYLRTNGADEALAFARSQDDAQGFVWVDRIEEVIVAETSGEPAQLGGTAWLEAIAAVLAEYAASPDFERDWRAYVARQRGATTR